MNVLSLSAMYSLFSAVDFIIDEEDLAPTPE
jgi:hypothetical protein